MHSASTIAVVAAAGLTLPVNSIGAQTRTVPTSLSTAPGAAPTNLKVTATSPTSVAVSWDLGAGVKSYLVSRQPAGGTTCCAAMSPQMTANGWQDGSLVAGGQYSYVVSVTYLDGRTGSTEVAVAMPYSATIALPAGALAASAVFPCINRVSAGPDPGTMSTSAGMSTPAGATIIWPSPSPAGTNYVIERAPAGTTSWTLVGSTCGGPSPVSVSSGGNNVHDLSGGVRPGSSYTYRVTRLGPSGEVGWNTIRWIAPCIMPPTPTATVSGSTVTVNWSSSPSMCGYAPYLNMPETYTVMTSFGYVKTKNAGVFSQDVIYGVPTGTHTIWLVAGWRPDVKMPGSATAVTVAY